MPKRPVLNVPQAEQAQVLAALRRALQCVPHRAGLSGGEPGLGT